MNKVVWKALAWQLALAGALVVIGAWFVGNTQANLAARGLSSGYDFLLESAGFAITEGPVPYEPGNSYLRAFASGAANTLVAAIPAVALTTLIGLALGVAAIGHNAVLRGVVRAYVDGARNVPLLVQVLLWYALLTNALPDSSAPLEAAGFFLSKAGLAMRHPFTGDTPAIGAFGVTGGLEVSPELTAIVVGLAGYSSAYCAEVVRAGLLAVPPGQWEAAHALGLTRAQSIRLIVLPQALRVILPPYISLVLNTIKNSSLGVAIGYPEIVSIGTTSLNQSGRAIECISLIAGLYLLLNLVTSLVLSLYNHRVQIRER
jgi:general L-amino acid transport system permease protein